MTLRSRRLEGVGNTDQLDGLLLEESFYRPGSFTKRPNGLRTTQARKNLFLDFGHPQRPPSHAAPEALRRYLNPFHVPERSRPTGPLQIALHRHQQQLPPVTV